jgi:hypothetical protein
LFGDSLDQLDRLSANPPQEKRIDREFESEEQARSFFHRWQADNDPIGQGYRQTMTRLTQKQLQDATDAFDRLPEHSTLLELVKQYDLKHKVIQVKLTYSLCAIFNLI